MAAQVIGSAVAQEAVTQVLSRFKENYKEKSDAKEHVERLEMAHIKLETVLETSQKWNVTSAPLLRWRSKLKRAAQECDQTLRSCKQRLEEEEETHREVRSSSLPKRVAHAARSLVSSILDRGINEDELRGSAAAVRRFEWFAEGAGEFLTYVELGGAPRRCMFFDPIVRNLLAGNGTKCCFVRGGQHLSLILQPISSPEQGMEAAVIFLLEDADAPENNFFLTLNLRLSESTDIVGVVVRCMQMFPSQLSSTAETVKIKLTQLPTQDLCWVPDTHSVYGLNGHLDDAHAAIAEWIRPKPRCCQQQDPFGSTRSSSAEPLPCDVFLEPVTQVYLLGHVALTDRKSSRQSQTSYLNLGGSFWPHVSSEDLPSKVGGSATEMMNWEATRRSLFANICFEELGETLVPKAVDCLRQDVAATSYEMLWKSRHGWAHLQAEKASSKPRRDKKVHAWTSEISELASSWIAHMPTKLLGSIVKWIQKLERLPPSLLLETNSCVHDCPIMLLSMHDLRALARKIKLVISSDA